MKILQNRELHKARPSLKMVSPLAHWTIVVMAVFNILLGLSLFFGIDQTKFTASLIIVNEFLTFKFWGIVFLAIGAIKLFALKTNNWNLSRRSLLLGVSIKAAWAVALTVRTFISPGTFFVNIIWIALAALQMGAYVHFMPPLITNKEQSRLDNDSI